MQRFTPHEDRRATYAQLTDAGRVAVRARVPVQLELTREYFGQHLTEAEIVELSRASRARCCAVASVRSAGGSRP